MTVGQKGILVRSLLIGGGLVFIGLGGFLGVTRLDDADKIASVAAAALGLPMAAYGMVLARREKPRTAEWRTAEDAPAAGTTPRPESSTHRTARGDDSAPRPDPSGQQQRFIAQIGNNNQYNERVENIIIRRPTE